MGVDDGHYFAVRVPGTVESVAEAVKWLEPAAVKRARAAGRRVERQGDVYAIACGDGKDRMGGMARHDWDPEQRLLTHPEHRTLAVSYPARLVVQSALGMGRD